MRFCENGMITAICVVAVMQNKTTLDCLRLVVKLKDENRGPSATTKAQCTQEMRLGYSPELHFQGILLSLRHLNISSWLV